MLKRFLGSAVRRVTGPLGEGLGRAGVTPNMMTVAGFLITLVTSVLIARGRFLIGGLILIAGAVFDMLDGAVARATGQSSKTGAFLDSTLDRFSDAAIFVGLIWYYSTGGPGRNTPEGLHLSEATLRLGAALALAALILSLMVSYVKARAEGLGFTCDVGLVERPERITVVCAGLILDQVIPALAVLAVASGLTVIQRFFHVWRQAGAA